MRGIAASIQKTFGSTGKQYVNRRCRNADYQGETGLQQISDAALTRLSLTAPRLIWNHP